MKRAPTVLDTLYRASFSPDTVSGWTSNKLWRDALVKARKFALDDSMSTFLGELGTRAFLMRKGAQPGTPEGDRVVAECCRRAEQIRMSARLPSEITWIEYDLRKCQARSNELLDRPVDIEQMPQREGWLLMQHPKIDTAFQAIVVSHNDFTEADGFDTWTFPAVLAWTCDMDTVMPWKPLPFDTERGVMPSEASTGLIGYKTERATFVQSDFITIPSGRMDAISELIKEWAGIQRRMWALLATINDLPVEVTDVRAAKGFVARGAYRKFLDHKTVTLTVPVKQYTKVINNALSLVHRRGGPVRQHWRKDFRRPLSPLCDHVWGADEKHMFCTRCEGRKIWIIEHVRGDSSRGFVTRDYNVTHPKEQEKVNG